MLEAPLPWCRCKAVDVPQWMHVVVHPSIPAELKMIVETLALKSRLAIWAEAKLQLDTLFMDA